jgi:membrane-associated phospholipid phosphatase
MKNDSPVNRRKYLVFATLLLIFLGVNEAYFRDTIFNFSVDFIQTLQTELDTAVFRYPFQIISAFANPIFIIVVFVILFILPTDKVLLVKLSMYVIFMGYILAIIKTLYGDPRPYWVSPDDSDLPNYSAPGIKPLETYAEYGNPSGHLFFTMAFYGYLYYLYIRANPERGAVNENLLRGNSNQADQADSWQEDPTFDMRLSAVYRLSNHLSKFFSLIFL